MHGITARQLEVLVIIQEHIKGYGWPPTIREIGIEMEINSLRGVTVHLEALEHKGCIVRGHCGRQITITDKGKEYLSGNYTKKET